MIRTSDFLFDSLGVVTNPMSPESYYHQPWTIPATTVEALIPNTDTLLKVMRRCGERGIQVSLKGTGHSFRPPGTAKPLLIAELQETYPPRVEGSIVRVPGCAKWIDLLGNLSVHDLQAPITTDYQGTTVAGTLIRGGFGIDSCRSGMQIDHVIELTAASPTCGVIKIRPGDNLFDATVGSIYPALPILEVQMRCEAEQRNRLLATYECDHIDVFTNHLIYHLAGQCDSFCSMDLTWFPRRKKMTFRLGELHETTDIRKIKGSHQVEVQIYSEYRRSLHSSVAFWYKSFGLANRVWLDYVVPLHAATEFARAVHSFCKIPAVRNHVECVYVLPITRPKLGPTLRFGPAPEPGCCYILFGVYMMPLNKAESFEMSRLGKTELYGCCTALEGRPYLHSEHYMDISDRIALAGRQAIKSVVKGMREHDPNEVLYPWAGEYNAVISGST